MPIYTPKERRAHYNAVAYGNAAVKADSKYSESEQRAYAKGQADARNEQAKVYVLGKYSSLSAAEKEKIRQEDRVIRQAYKDGQRNLATVIKKARRDRIANNIK